MPIQPWFVYLARCADNTIYTGISNDVEKRIAKHNAGKGAQYTKGRLPVKLLYQEECADRSEASKRELQLKKLSKEEKERLVARKFLHK